MELFFSTGGETPLTLFMYARRGDGKRTAKRPPGTGGLYRPRGLFLCVTGLDAATEYEIPLTIDTWPPGGERHTERVQVRALGSGVPAG